MPVRMPITDRLPGKVTLKGHHVRLLPLDWPEPGGALTQMMAEAPDSLWDFMLWGPFADASDAEHALRARQKDGQMMVLVNPRGEAVGTASFLRIRPDHGSAELGSIAYAPVMQRSPAGTEAMLLMMRHLFDDLRYRRCEWKCNAANDRSFRAAERLGFTFEGIHRHDMISKGKNRDTAWFSITDEEWPARAEALQVWCDPANFDEEGYQKQALRSLIGGPYRIPAL